MRAADGFCLDSGRRGGWRSVSARLEENDKIVLVDTAEPGTRLLVEHIPIDGLAAQERNAPFPRVTFFLFLINLCLQAFDLKLIICIGVQTTLVIDGMPKEIAAGSTGQAIKRERKENSPKATANDHFFSFADQG